MEEMIMRPSLYLETTIPSYLAAKPSNNLTNLYRQIVTRKFWDTKQDSFKIYTSDYTVKECRSGNPEVAKRRLQLLEHFPRLRIEKEVDELSDIYMRLLSIPEKSRIDTFHLAICVSHQINFLLSWNCIHLGAVSGTRIASYNEKNGLFIPVLTTPESFVEIGGIDDEV
jgi:hypothetical protein